MINPELGHTLLFVANPIKSGEFYQMVFGMPPVEQSPTFVMFILKNGVKLGLWSRYTALPRVDALPGALELSFAADDIDGLFQELGKKGVTILQAPTDMDFGRTFVFLDLDGHRIRIHKLHERE